MSLSSGDPCPKNCGGRLRVRTSRRADDNWQHQTLKCKECGHEVQALVPADKVWRRDAS